MTSIVKVRAVGAACLFTALVGINSACTQYVAKELSYHSWLGAPLFGQIYNPFSWVEWMQKFYSYAPTTYHHAMLFFGAGTFAALMTLKLFVGLKTRSARKNEGAHGTASFATAEQIKQSGLLPRNNEPREGVYVGGYDDPKNSRTRYLRHDGPEHICVIAPTRSGKGVSLIVPTLLSHLESIVIYDIKGELKALTSGCRKEWANNIVLFFDPAEEFGSCAWNPLEEIRFGTSYQVSDAQNIALMVIDDDGKGIEGNHWRSSAYDLIVGMIIHALYKARDVGHMPSLGDVGFMLTGGGDFAAPPVPAQFDDGDLRPLAGLFAEMQNVFLDENDENAQEAQLTIRAAGRRFGETAGKELSGIISTATTSFALYREKTVRKNTSRSDFKISDLMDHERPVSLYFITTPDNLVRLRPLARLLLTMIMTRLTGKMEFEAGRAKTAHKHKLLLMLDEFPSLGKLAVFEKALAHCAGYGIKAYLVIQDVQQLYKEYGKDQSILSNCHIQLAFAPNNQETAKLLSEMAGTTTVIHEQISTSGKRFGTFQGQASRSYQAIQRPLMTPREIRDMPLFVKNNDGEIIKGGEMLVFLAGLPVIKGRQTPYFLDPTFNERSKIPPPETSDTVRGSVKEGFGA